MEEATQQPQDQPIVGYCRICGRSLTAADQHISNGALYCDLHAPFTQGATAPPPPSGFREAPSPYGSSPYTQGTTPNPGASPYQNGPQTGGPYAGGPGGRSAATPIEGSPGLAFLLGLIPGVGAVYNAQYVKAIVHVVVLGLLISILESGAGDGFEVLFGMLISIWYFYMPFEAYHTARKRNLGIPVDDFSSIVPRGRKTGFPAGPVALIGLGVVFLLAQFDLLRIGTILRYWPLALILVGAWMLYDRMAQRPEQP